MKDWLKECEKDWDIEILFACEAGSFAWGTNSSGSDYDVRFIYKRSIRSYLSLQKPMEVLDFDSPVDAHGWDLFKAFHLLSKSNPSIYEWAYSPIIYIDKHQFSLKLRNIIEENYSTYSLTMHYYHLMKRNMDELSRKESLGTKEQKQLIQALRAFLIIRKIIENKQIIGGPYFEVKKNSDNIFERYYYQAVIAKQQEFIMEETKIKEVLSFLLSQKEGLANQISSLGKKEPFTEELEGWLWELLGL